MVYSLFNYKKNGSPCFEKICLSKFYPKRKNKQGRLSRARWHHVVYNLFNYKRNGSPWFEKLCLSKFYPKGKNKQGMCRHHVVYKNPLTKKSAYDAHFLLIV